jgi:hypothetical protein
MKHPSSRSERRGVRETYINKRKFIQLHIFNDSPFYRIPYIHETHQYEQYMKWVHWQEASEDERKVILVERALDGLDKPEVLIGPRGKWIMPAEPPWSYWHPPEWGRYAKWNLTCSCASCQANQQKYTERRKRREQLKRDISENLKNFED